MNAVTRLNEEGHALIKDIQLRICAGEILGIRLLDHIIISEHRSYSFANAGQLR